MTRSYRIDRSRRWTFTSYGLEGPIEFTDRLTYLIYGLEECPKTKLLHWQGYLESDLKLSLKQVQKIIGDDTAHCENAREDGRTNLNYCDKDGIYLEYGTYKRQGSRSDIKELIELIKEKKSNSELLELMPSQTFMYSKHIEKVRHTLQADRTEAPKVIWIHGPAGCGKTSYVADKHPDYYVKDNSKWWDGYEQQEAILIDDYETPKEGLTYKELLRLFDRYKYQGQTKGGYVKINSPYIYITHTEPPEIVFGYKDDPEWGAQMERRISKMEMTRSGL